MRRALGLIMIAGLVLGAGACSSSGGDKKADTKSTTDSGDTNGETASGNKAVQQYCDAVDAYVKKAKAAEGDASKAAALADDSKDLTSKATALATAGLNADDAQAVADCTKKSTDALLPS